MHSRAAGLDAAKNGCPAPDINFNAYRASVLPAIACGLNLPLERNAF
jgi:hypothetical protein